MKKTFRNNRGFSLVEMMVTVFLFSFIMAGIYATLYVGQESWETSKVKMELQQNLRQAMDWMKDDLRQAGSSSISTVSANGQWYSSITFKKPSGTITNGSIVWDAYTTRFDLQGTSGRDLTRTYNSVTKLLAQNISTLQFRRQSATPNILEVAMTGQKNTARRKSITYQLNFEIELRNN